MPEEPHPQVSPQSPPSFMPPTVSPEPAASAPAPVASSVVQPPVQQTAMPVSDAVPTPTPVAQVSQPSAVPNDQVWISKEEYQRLRQAEATAVTTATSGVVPTKPEKLFGTLQIVTSATAACALLLGLLAQSYLGGILIAPALIILTLTGIFTWLDYQQSLKVSGYLKRHKGRNITLLVCSILVLALPVVMPIVMVLMFMIVCASGGCKGS